MIDSPENHWKLGVFTLGSLTLGLAGLLFFGSRGLNRETVAAQAYFDESVEGLNPGSPVLYRGVRLGQVDDISLALNGRDVEVRMGLYRDQLERLGALRSGRLQLKERGLQLELIRSGLTGIATLEMDVFDPEVSPPRELDFPEPPNTVPTRRSTLRSLGQSATETLAQLPELVQRGSDALVRFESFLGSLEKDLDGADLPGLSTLVVDRLQSVPLESLDATLTRWSQVGTSAEDLLVALAGERDALHASLLAFEGTAVEAREALAQVGTDLSGTSREFTEVARAASGTLDELDQALADLRRVLDLLENDPSALLFGSDR